MKYLFLIVPVLLMSCSSLKKMREERKHEKWIRDGNYYGWLDSSSKHVKDSLNINQDTSRKRVGERIITIINEVNTGSPCDTNGKITPEAANEIAEKTVDNIKENYALVPINKPFFYKDPYITTKVIIDKNGNVLIENEHHTIEFDKCIPCKWEEYWYLVLIGILVGIIIGIVLTLMVLRFISGWKTKNESGNNK